MEQFIKFGVILTDIFALSLGCCFIYFMLAGKRASTGMNPRNPPFPLLLAKALFMVGGTYFVSWSCIHLGLDFGLLKDSSRPVLFLASFNSHIGRAFIELFLLVWFALFGISMFPFLIGKEKALATRLLGLFAFLTSVLVFGANVYLLVRLFSKA
jgi:hypothetical protein